MHTPTILALKSNFQSPFAMPVLPFSFRLRFPLSLF